ncbi:VOC family protein [Nonomuraea jiangxiensis]|uniref:Glyoxalase/Bleomycin resistance protein/Dioxygenase superfamily protein n=1 Tax=Nonomuraea jiangxiensis TaxID=633440 RepID=A0A1G9E702_9ACTN|nr:VOC family protein [Nonomuraea jiangxiensis]SDK71912.1 Glyoxalase/Bleomycin resistance protein/Dioxygenase superfamily protein [Nonomuraea jiangxiensis]
MGGIAKFRSIVLDTADPKGLAEFYANLLGWPITSVEDDWVVVSDGGSPMRLAFQLAPDHRPPTWPHPEVPQQLHLDVTVEDMDEAEAQAIKMGAVKHEHQPSEEDDFRVFLDPAGHPFCLCVD